MSKYSNIWQGLDQGVEHTWQPDVIEAVTKEIAKLGSVEHTNPLSPLYPRLQELFPNRTWVSIGSDGSPRTIFRRSNTWARLGLVDASGGRMRLTPLGESFLIGDVTVTDVLINALANHDEDGERPFSIISNAFLSLPTRVFTLEDIEFGIMQNYRPDADDLALALSAPHLNLSPTRKRRVRAMVSRLEDVDAVYARGDGWVSGDLDALSRIAGRGMQARLAAEIIEDASVEIEDRQVRRRSDPIITSRAFQAIIPEFAQNTPPARIYDPQKRKELLEKASIGHAHLLRMLATFIQTQGFEPTEDKSSYDLAFVNNNSAWIFEAKTCTGSNAKDQIRKAISQLLEYKWRGRSFWPESVKLAIVIDKSPIGLIEDWMFEFLHEDRGISLIWQEEGVFKVWNPQTKSGENFAL